MKDSTNEAAFTGKFYLKGVDISLFTGSLYNAGALAIDSIPDIPKDSIDPKTKGDYRIGVYS